MNKVEFFVESAKFEVWAVEKLASLGFKIFCFTFYRDPKQQKIEYDAGRSRVLFGKHQKWEAKDYAIFKDFDEDMVIDKDEIRWGFDPDDPNDPYLILGEEWERRGGGWGGRWANPVDPYHFEG